jgi:glycosyltransferase 2 family protein
MLTDTPTARADRLPSGRETEGAGTPPATTAPNGAATPDDVQETLRRRALSPHTLISFLVAAAIVVFAVRWLDVDPAAIWSEIRGASPLILLWAFVLWYGSFFVRAWRWRRMLAAAGRDDGHAWRIPPTRGLAEIVTLSWFANSLMPAKLGDAYRGYLLKRDGGVPFSTGIGTILAERFADAMMLLVVLATSAFVVFGDHLPPEAGPALTLGVVLLVVGAVGLTLMWFTREALVRYLPYRLQGAYARLNGAVFSSLRNPAVVLGIGLLLWFGDGMRVWLVARSLGAGIPPTVAILVAVMGALLTIVPFTPAGLGVVELGVASMLIGVFGLDPTVAGSIIVLDRVVAYWSLLAVGAVLYARRTHRDYRAAGPPSR